MSKPNFVAFSECMNFTTISRVFIKSNPCYIGMSITKINLYVTSRVFFYLTEYVHTYNQMNIFFISRFNWQTFESISLKITSKSKSKSTLFESENERQKIEPVPILLPRASRNFPDVKTRNEIFFHNWTSEIIPFIRFGMQMDGT